MCLVFEFRAAIRLIRVAAAVLLLTGWVGLAAGPVPASGERVPAMEGGTHGWQRLEFTRPQMGIPFRIVVHARDEPAAQRAVESAYARVAELNDILSDYDPESENNRFTHETPVGVPGVVSPDLWEMLDRSRRLARQTDGAFDATVGPVVNLWRRARRHRELPSPGLVQEALGAMGWRNLVLDARRRTVTMKVPGMRFDFGGIAKGYAADEALRVLREQGFPHALIAASGDITVGAAPPGARGWRVEFGSDGRPGSPAPHHLHLANCSVSTSGDLYQNVVIGGRRYSHIVDPRTGIGLEEQCLVSVLARDGVTADSLATAVSVLGPERGLKLVNRTRGAAAMILQPGENGPPRVLESRAMRRALRAAAAP